MHHLIRIFTIICFLFFIVSCKPLKKTNQQRNSSTAKLSTAKVNGPYQSSETLHYDLLHTKLEVNFDWEKQYLHGVATLSLKPYFYPQSILTLDAKGMEIHSVLLLTKTIDKNTSSENLKFRYDQKLLTINLAKTYTRKDTFIVQINYTAKPNELKKGGSEAITSDIGLYFINPLNTDPDKPRQIWTQGETEASSCWFPTIDSPNERTTQEMFITVDTNFAVLSNGKFISSKNNLNGTKTVYWKQDLPHAPYLFMMAIGEYAVVNDKWHNMEVDYYVEPSYKQFAKNIFGNTPEMLEFFSNKLGYKYPWAKYSQVVVRDYVSGAMENTTATIFMEALQSDDRALADENWESIIAHELFHHWFGDLVTCESWSNLPLNESFANYSEYLWAEYKYGIDEADYLGEKEGNEYFYEALTKQVPLIRYHYSDKEDMFDRHSYNKGGRVLHMLRKYVGDEAFFEALKLYLHRHQFTSVEIHHLRLAFEEITGEDLNWFFNQWFLSPGHPEIHLEHVYSHGTLHLTVKQIQDTLTTPVYRLPVKVDIWVNGIKTTHSILIEKAEHIFEIPVPAQPDLALFDSDLQLLGYIYHEKSIEENIFQFNNYQRFLARNNALQSILKNQQIDYSQVGKGVNSKTNPFDNPIIKNTLIAALEDPFWAIRNIAINQFSTYPLTDFSKVAERIESIALNDPKPQVRANAIYLLSSYYNKEFIHVYKKGLNEKSYSVAGAALSAYLKSEDQSIKINFEEIEAINNISIIIPLAEHYIFTGTKTKYNWFREKLKKGSPRVIYNLISLFMNYALLLEKEEQDDAKKILKDISENNKYEYIRYQANISLKEFIEKTKQ
jgi:aminopeptidase N